MLNLQRSLHKNCRPSARAQILTSSFAVQSTRLLDLYISLQQTYYPHTVLNTLKTSSKYTPSDLPAFYHLKHNTHLSAYTLRKKRNISRVSNVCQKVFVKKSEVRFSKGKTKFLLQIIIIKRFKEFLVKPFQLYHRV